MSSKGPDERLEKRHESLWFSDGNVVLSAVEDSTGDTVVFRIHKSSLARRSKVFESMFKLPQGENTVGGAVEAHGILKLPLVRVPDAAEDVEALLEALYDPLCVIGLSTSHLSSHCSCRSVDHFPRKRRLRTRHYE